MGPMVDHWFEEYQTEREEPMTDKTLTIRRADAADNGALVRLAALDSASPPTGNALLAEVGDELWAAIDLDTGTAIADPFRPSGDMVELLRASLRGEEKAERGALARLLPRAA
jgi:hypothetical protein